MWFMEVLKACALLIIFVLAIRWTSFAFQTFTFSIILFVLLFFVLPFCLAYAIQRKDKRMRKILLKLLLFLLIFCIFWTLLYYSNSTIRDDKLKAWGRLDEEDRKMARKPNLTKAMYNVFTIPESFFLRHGGLQLEKEEWSSPGDYHNDLLRNEEYFREPMKFFKEQEYQPMLGRYLDELKSYF